MMLFGQFVGSWAFDGWQAGADGTREELSGEWRFDWALDGTAIQDVLVVPGQEHGTTIRFYDPERKRWEITWITPVQRAVRRLIGGRVGDRIVLEGTGENGRLLRWSFNDIEPSSFVWHGEVSEDGGATWQLREEMRLRRVSS